MRFLESEKRFRTSSAVNHKTGLAVCITGFFLSIVLCWTGSAHALTTPVAGAVSKPAAFETSWPIEAGVEGYLSATYGPNNGSSLHVGTDSTNSANDYYAFDIILPSFPNDGLGQPILAVAAGTVVKVGWATAGWANYGQRVIILHDFVDNDGHNYISHYAHLNAIYVSEGQHVDKGDILGELGDSCDGDNQQLSCPWFGAHLHFAIHRDSNIGGSGTGGSYGGNAVVPEPMDGYEDFYQGMTFVSANNGQPPPPCYVIPPQETVLEEDGPCFARRGPSQYWHPENSGSGGHCLWTYTIDEPDPSNYAYWNLHFEQGGDYELWAYSPTGFGESVQARYEIRHDATEELVIGDQAAHAGGWISLGTFNFAAGGDQWIMLTDNSGEPYNGPNDNTMIAFDAVKIAPATSCECTAGDEPETRECGMCGNQSRSCDGCHWSAWTTCTGEGECHAEDIEKDATGCPEGESRSRVCSGNCTWGTWSACQDETIDAGPPPDGPPQDGAHADGTPDNDSSQTGSGCGCVVVAHRNSGRRNSGGWIGLLLLSVLAGLGSSGLRRKP